MSKRKNKYPTRKAIVEYWAENIKFPIAEWIDKKEFLELGEYHCFACGILPNVSKTQFCHIKPWYKSKDDSVSNIHLLCKECHTATEYWEGCEKYWDFIKRRTMIDTILAIGIRYGAIQPMDLYKK